MADFNEAIKLDPQNALAWRVRGATWAGLANYEKALAEYSESIRLDPDNPDSLHHRATMFSVCPDDRIRNGKQALADATKACEESDWKSPIYLSGLATANAELGDFDLAVKWMEKAIELSPMEHQTSTKSRLEQFRQHKPIRGTWR
jgi:tetratricopeptide (TPR) repeat protein